MEIVSRYNPNTYSYSRDFVALHPQRLQQFERANVSRLPERRSNSAILNVLGEMKSMELEKQPVQLEESEDNISECIDNQFSLPDLSEIQKVVPEDDSYSEIDLPEIQNHGQLPIPIFLRVNLMKHIDRCRILQIGLEFTCCKKTKVSKRKRNETEFHEEVATEGCGVCGQFKLEVINIKVQTGPSYEFARTNLPGTHFKIVFMKLVTKCGDKWKRTSNALLWRAALKTCAKLCQQCTENEQVGLRVSIGDNFLGQENLEEDRDK